MSLPTDTAELVLRAFSVDDAPAATSLLLTIEPHHVMAGSEYNLASARGACIVLSRGDLSQLANYINAAKVDFRDVIMWAMEDAKTSGS